MEKRNAADLKERILRFLRIRGPSIPVYIAKDINQSILFTSAFLSELLSEKMVNQSYLRVGSSPVFFLNGQEHGLENFSNYLKSKEKDAFALLKENKFLIDVEQEPAIRVALRAIKDFAIPFQKRNQTIWRYFLIPEIEFENSKEELVKEEILPVMQAESATEKNKEFVESGQLINDDGSKKKEIRRPKKKKPVSKKASKKNSEKTNEKFFNKVKEFLLQKEAEIIGIEGFSKEDLILRAMLQGEEKLIVAYNKKRIDEDDLIKAHKKSQEFNLNYSILNLGQTPKKIENLIESVRTLDKIEKME